MGYHFASAQLCQKVLWPIEGFHLDVDSANLRECMSVRAGASGNAEGASEFLRAGIDLGIRPAVEDLDNIDIGCDPFDRLLPKVATARVVRVFEVDQASLVFDRGDRPFRGQAAGNRLLQEEANQFAITGHDLLADYSCFAGGEERLDSRDAFVVGKEDGGEAELATEASYLEGRDPAI